MKNRFIPYDIWKSKIHSESKYTSKQKYRLYLETDVWKSLSQERLKVDDYRCRMCNRDAECVHHRVYPKVLGEETINDLTSLCNTCHKNFHKPPCLDDLKNQPLSGRCPLCERRITKLNPHSMCSAKVAVLKHIKYLENIGYNQVKTLNGSKGFKTTDGKEHEAIKESRVHTQRLKYFGLLDHEPGRKKGGYSINLAGNQFLEGFLKVPNVIWCRDGEVVKKSKELVGVEDVLGVILGESHWDAYANITKHKYELK
tara:strand:+ start:38189 stop:38956 length:768 start_codon:yes stop_codon:yes gene_type:complete